VLDWTDVAGRGAVTSTPPGETPPAAHRDAGTHISGRTIHRQRQTVEAQVPPALSLFPRVSAGLSAAGLGMHDA